MKKTLSYLLVVAFFASACSTHRARIDYNDFSEEGVALKAGEFEGENLGMVEGEDGGAIWDNCTEKARGSVQELIYNAKAKGANAIGNIRWHASDSSEPRCKKGWGYFLIWPFILTPLFMSTAVEGDAFKATKLGENMYPLPTNQEEMDALVSELVVGQ